MIFRLALLLVTSALLAGPLALGQQTRTLRASNIIESVKLSADFSPKIYGYILKFSQPDLSQTFARLKQPTSDSDASAAILRERWEFEAFLSRHTSQTQKAKLKNISPADLRYLPKEVFNGVVIDNIDQAEASELKEASGGMIVSIAPNQEYRKALFESVPKTGAPSVWAGHLGGNNKGVNGAGRTIGIIDTGVDYTHPDLGCTEGQKCEFPTKKVVGGYNFIDRTKPPMDDEGHGTHVAATAAGQGTFIDSDGKLHDLPGVAFGAKIYAYKVINDQDEATIADIIDAIGKCATPDLTKAELARQKRGEKIKRRSLDVCNLSLGSPTGKYDDPTSAAIDNSARYGVTFVIAAGNTGTGQPTWSPGTARTAITVGAACKPTQIEHPDGVCTGPMAYFSCRGPVSIPDSNGNFVPMIKPDVSSFGYKICAAHSSPKFPQGDAECGLDLKHKALNGTSMASPHVAGMVALMKAARPSLTPFEIKQILISTATPLYQFGNSGPMVDENFGGAGLANVTDAVVAAHTENKQPPSVSIRATENGLQGVAPVLLSSTVRDLVGIAKVEYFRVFDGQQVKIGESVVRPYGLALVPEKVGTEGVVFARATSLSDLTADSQPVNYKITKRTAEITSPKNGQTVVGTPGGALGEVTVSELQDVTEVSLFAEGINIGNRGGIHELHLTGPGALVVGFSPEFLSAGHHSLMARVKLKSGLAFFSPPIEIEVTKPK